ncbi:nuclear transport factor 2 family protein [Bradyrhizobium sp. NBAIM08]|uniref:nuclear transport factor 2 family protein n=1 Tax=Bradyrhizobium sp. NBAIM08 TaxID=2793815 RepID=UPI001CD378AB|nr:nuclear transport factor 2 family protein [Bradyrhizobium sp. NBAIM08]MCA1474198.1 nuclear transport factor 2 family protein [Bradyrhizobium sp. NBAIM08]
MATIDYNGIMGDNLIRVFSERDPAKRMIAIRELYSDDAVLYEPEGHAKGGPSICEAVTSLLASLPREFVFTQIGPAQGHHGVARLRWRVGPLGGPTAASGTDVAQFEANRIQSLHVFLDPVPSKD